ncbi:MAG: hydroxyacylglutathione hydrolase [Kiritimatiellae bacterium]|nr:hydroxyacylglutathione hydrolase [Kiritimatiellia bacterium]
MDILMLPAWEDNYVYIAHSHGRALAVDPCDAALVNRALQNHNLSLTHILVTHHHSDHTAGIPELTASHNCTVIGPDDPRIDTITQPTHDKESFPAAGSTFQSIAVPGHTRTHLAFHCKEESILFSGDTLFVAGCGRIFEGTAEQMWQSLLRLRSLPDDTRVYCGHNYTHENLNFAAHQEPENMAIRHYLDALIKSEDAPLLAGSSRIEQEKSINPFLRCDDAAFSDHVIPIATSPAERFAMLRKMKDRW